MEVRVYATLRPIVGGRSIDVDAGCSTVREVIDHLIAQYPDLHGRLLDEDGVRQYVAVMVDGRDIRHLDGLDTAVVAGSELDIFPPVAGGAPHPRDVPPGGRLPAIEA